MNIIIDAFMTYRLFKFKTYILMNAENEGKLCVCQLTAAARAGYNPGLQRHRNYPQQQHRQTMV